MSDADLSDDLVTVLMPVFNGCQYLGASMSSILNQTHRNLQVIAIDDGSTDDAPNILARLARSDERLTIIRQPNSGISSALNTGLAAASGIFTARLDSDDLMMPERIATQLAFLRQHPDLGFCASYMKIIDGSGRVLRSYTPPPRTREELAGQIARREPITYTHPTVMFRTALMRELGGFDRSLEPCEDTDMFGRMITAGSPGLVIPQELTSYRMHAGSVSGSKARLQIEMLDHVRRNFYRRLAGMPEFHVRDREQYIRAMSAAGRLIHQIDIYSQTLRQLSAYDRASGRQVRSALRLGTSKLLRPHKFIARLTSPLRSAPKIPA